MAEEILWVVLVTLLLVIKTQKTAQAHGVWFTRRCDAWQLALGEGSTDNAYRPEMVTDISTYDADYQKIAAVAIPHEHFITLEAPAALAVAVVSFDYGLWSNRSDGIWVNAPMNEVPGATIGTHALKYSVNYFSAVKKLQPLPKIPLQIVPLTDPALLRVGDGLTVQVLSEGKPLPFVDLIPDMINHHKKSIKTDAAGQAVITVNNANTNVIGIEIAFDYAKKTEQATRDKLCATLSFTVDEESAAK